MDWLYKISVTCFAASYLVVLILEITRVFFNVSYRRIVQWGFAIAGLLAHTIYLVWQGLLEVDASGIWLSNWTAWCFAAAWLMAAAYLWASLKKPESALGLFLLPLVIGLITAGLMLSDSPSFSPGEAKSGWNMVHGYSLMLGTVSVALGFVFGLIYLIQANRLKQKRPQSRFFRLPSLEWLRKYCERSLIASTLLMALGLISGIAINLINQRGGQEPLGTVAWSHPVVWSSAILFLWMLAISVFSRLYRPAQQGRKVAYLVVSCFLFLLFELAIVWIAGHADRSSPADQTAGAEVVKVRTTQTRFMNAQACRVEFLGQIDPRSNEERS